MRFRRHTRRMLLRIAGFATSTMLLASPMSAPDLRIVALGDSLTAQGYAELVGAHFGMPVLNMGIGGQRAEAIAARYGAVPIHIALATSKLQPGPNDLRVVSPEIFRAQDQVERRAHVTIAGVRGTYIRTASGTPPVDRNVFVPDAGQALPATIPYGATMVLDGQGDMPDILLLCMGRNDPQEKYPRVAALIDAVVARHARVSTRVVILGIPNAARPDEVKGTPRYDAILAFNAMLARRYPDAFLDIRAAYNGGGNSSLPEDRRAMAADIPPASLHADQIHYNATGRRVWAKAVIDFVDHKHWLDTAPAR